jgi:predicted nucleic acid-binding protein
MGESPGFSRGECQIELVPDDLITEKLDEARKIMYKIDPTDVVFIATALCFKNAAIWSDDKDFKRQDKVMVRTTGEVLKGD